MEMTLGRRGSSSLEGRPAYPQTAADALDGGVGRGCTIPLPLIFRSSSTSSSWLLFGNYPPTAPPLPLIVSNSQPLFGCCTLQSLCGQFQFPPFWHSSLCIERREHTVLVNSCHRHTRHDTGEEEEGPLQSTAETMFKRQMHVSSGVAQRQTETEFCFDCLPRSAYEQQGPSRSPSLNLHRHNIIIIKYLPNQRRQRLPNLMTRGGGWLCSGGGL